MFISRHARKMRTAISPRFAIRTFLNMPSTCGILAREQLPPPVTRSLRVQYAGVYQRSLFFYMGAHMKRIRLIVAGLILAALPVFSQPALSQQAVVLPPESLVVDGVSPVPASLAETA